MHLIAQRREAGGSYEAAGLVRVGDPSGYTGGPPAFATLLALVALASRVSSQSFDEFLTTLGIVLGTAAALALTGSLRSLLFAVSPGDPLTLAAVATMLIAVSLVATFAPVRRATRIAASTALRAD